MARTVKGRELYTLKQILKLVRAMRSQTKSTMTGHRLIITVCYAGCCR